MLKVSYKDITHIINEKYNTIGDLQESILSKFRLNIYDINHIVFENTMLGLGNLKFENIVPLDLKDLKIREKKDDINKSNIEIMRHKYTTYIQFREDEILATSMQYDSYSNLNTSIRRPQYQRYPNNLLPMRIDTSNIPTVNSPATFSVFLNAFLRSGLVPFVVERENLQQTPHQIVAKEEDIDILLKTDTYLSILPILKHKQSDCNICLEIYENESIVSIMPTCSCVYHNHCIKKWLSEESNKCPICRIEINNGIRKDLLNLENNNNNIDTHQEIPQNNYQNNLMPFLNLPPLSMEYHRVNINMDLDEDIEDIDDLPELVD
jgi:hypothetical protein